MTTYSADLHPDERRRRETEKRRRYGWQRSPRHHAVKVGEPAPEHDFAAIRFAWYSIVHEWRMGVVLASRGVYDDKAIHVKKHRRESAWWLAAVDRLNSVKAAKRAVAPVQRAEREEMAESKDCLLTGVANATSIHA